MLVLQNNREDELGMDSDGDFEFNELVTEGDDYDVTILEQPSGQDCVVTNGSGVATENVTNVEVTCTDLGQFTVGGMVEGLPQGESVVLQNNGGDNLTVSQSGQQALSFTFDTALVDGASYSVTILTQPNFGECMVLSGSGTISGQDVGNVEVSCFP